MVAENLHNLSTQMVYCSELNTDNVWVISNIVAVEKIEVHIYGKFNSPGVTMSGVLHGPVNDCINISELVQLGDSLCL